MQNLGCPFSTDVAKSWTFLQCVLAPFFSCFKLRSSRSASNRSLRATVGQNSSSVQMTSACHVCAAVLVHVARSGRMDADLDERSLNQDKVWKNAPKQEIVWWISNRVWFSCWLSPFSNALLDMWYFWLKNYFWRPYLILLTVSISNFFSFTVKIIEKLSNYHIFHWIALKMRTFSFRTCIKITWSQT